MAKCLMLSPELSIWEILHMKFGLVASLEAMWPQVEAMDMIASFPEVDIPITVVHGRHDYCTVYSLVDAFLRKLKAPQKTLFTFERSGHSPHREESDHFVEAVKYSFLDIPLPESYPYAPKEYE